MFSKGDGADGWPPPPPPPPLKVDGDAVWVNDEDVWSNGEDVCRLNAEDGC